MFSFLLTCSFLIYSHLNHILFVPNSLRRSRLLTRQIHHLLVLPLQMLGSANCSCSFESASIFVFFAFASSSLFVLLLEVLNFLSQEKTNDLMSHHPQAFQYFLLFQFLKFHAMYVSIALHLLIHLQLTPWMPHNPLP